MDGTLSFHPSVHKYLQILLRNCTYDVNEILPQPSSPVMDGMKKGGLKRSTEGVHGLGVPLPKEVFALFSNDTHNSDETSRQPSSPRMYQSLFMTLEKSAVGSLRGLPPKTCICFLLRNYTHNSDETWPPYSPPMMYLSLFMTWKKNWGRRGICICFLFWGNTHNFDETWPQSFSPVSTKVCSWH